MTVLLLVGPTAVGKSAVALLVARAAGAEIISADARALYRGLEVGTDRPSDAALHAVAHHLIGVLDVHESYDAARFRRDCERIVSGIHKRGRRAMIVGGSTLYVRALTQGLFPGPPADPEFRKQLAACPVEELRQELHSVDPDAAARIAPADRVRIVRALEVYKTTGRPISSFWGTQRPAPWPLVKVGLYVERQEHYRRIERRVDRMLEKGLMGEVGALHDAGVPDEAPAARTIGYRELFPVIRGAMDVEEARHRIVASTKAYARRQLAWFRKEDLRWIDVTGRGADEVARQLLRIWTEADRCLESDV